MVGGSSDVEELEFDVVEGGLRPIRRMRMEDIERTVTTGLLLINSASPVNRASGRESLHEACRADSAAFLTSLAGERRASTMAARSASCSGGTVIVQGVNMSVFQVSFSEDVLCMYVCIVYVCMLYLQRQE